MIIVDIITQRTSWNVYVLPLIGSIVSDVDVFVDVIKAVQSETFAVRTRYFR